MSKLLQLVSKSALLPVARAAARPGTPAVEERGFAARPKRNPVNCACAGHPWPEEEVTLVQEKKKDCEFDFRKLHVNPYDPPCDCKDPPAASDCAAAGRPREVCCRSTRQYGCFCEEADEESCEEEEEEEVVAAKTCDLDFKKLEVNPYDEPCDCRDPPAVAACADLPRGDACCRAPHPFGCPCDAYDRPGIDCLKQKAPPATPRPKKDCGKKSAAKCL